MKRSSSQVFELLKAVQQIAVKLSGFRRQIKQFFVVTVLYTDCEYYNVLLLQVVRDRYRITAVGVPVGDQEQNLLWIFATVVENFLLNEWVSVLLLTTPLTFLLGPFQMLLMCTFLRRWILVSLIHRSTANICCSPLWVSLFRRCSSPTSKLSCLIKYFVNHLIISTVVQ